MLFLVEGRNKMNKFGGEWTKQKLGVLQDYFNFYMTALKNIA